MKIVDVNLEEAAEESKQDREDLARLHKDLDELLSHEEAIRIPVAVRDLIDGGIDPVVVAKTLLIGDREGSFLYSMAVRSTSLAQDELAAVAYLSTAINGSDAAAAATFCVSGAVWIATQFKIERSMLQQFVVHAQRRARREYCRGYGAVDLVDNHGIQNRAWIVKAIAYAELPMFAPLEMTKDKS